MTGAVLADTLAGEVLGEGLAWAAPVLFLAALGWLVWRADRVIDRALPDLEWERSLGWLNIRAERRANAAMRWVGYAVLVLLFDALVIIFWAAKDFPRVADWSDPEVLGELVLRVPALVICLGIWVIYFGCGLLPRLRLEREEAAYRRFRAELQAEEEERASAAEPAPAHRHATLPRPYTRRPEAASAPRRGRRLDPPGG